MADHITDTALPAGTPAAAAPAAAVPVVATPQEPPAVVPSEAAPAAPLAPVEPAAVVPDAAAAPVEAAPDAPKSEPTLLEKFALDAAKPAVDPDAKPVEAAPVNPDAVAPVVDPNAVPVYTDLKMPEGLVADADKMAAYTGILAEHRVPADTGQKLLDLHSEAIQTYAKAAEKAQWDTWNATRAEWTKQVLADPEIGGAGHVTAMGAIARMRDLFVNADDGKPGGAFDQFLNTTGAGDHPQFLKLLYNAARRFDEPPMPPRDPKPTPTNGQDPRGRKGVLYDRSGRNQ